MRQAMASLVVAVWVLASVLPATAASDGHLDVERQGCETTDYTYDRKDVDHPNDGCETITVQAGPAESNDFARTGIDHEPEGVAPHSGSVKVGRKGASPGDDSNRTATAHWSSGYAVTGPRTLSPGGAPAIQQVDEAGASPTLRPENAGWTPEHPERQSFYFGMDDNWIFGEHHSTSQAGDGYEDHATGPVSGGGWDAETRPNLEHPEENVDPTDRSTPIRAADGGFGFCADGICAAGRTGEKTVYQGGDESAPRRPAYVHSGNPANGATPADDGSDQRCNFRDPDPDCQEFRDNQGKVYIPWGLTLYQDPNPDAPERFGPALWDYPMPSSHVGGEGVRLLDETIVDLREVAPPVTLNLGHRGTGTNSAGNPYPENTIVSFLKALDEGADGVELDVMLAATDDDGDPFSQLVIMHDESLTRTTTCKGTPGNQDNCVEGRTAADIRASCLPVNGSGQTALEAGLVGSEERVPTLEESLDALFAHDPDAIVNIEIKSQPPTDVDSIAELCSSADPEHRSTHLVVELLHTKYASRRNQIILSSFDPTAMALAGLEDPSLETAYLSVPANQAPSSVPAVPTAGSGAALAAALHLDGLHPNERETDAAVVGLSRALGLAVRPWTVNDPCEMQRLIALEVDAIITDDPDVLGQEMTGPSACP